MSKQAESVTNVQSQSQYKRGSCDISKWFTVFSDPKSLYLACPLITRAPLFIIGQSWEKTLDGHP